MTTAVYVTVGQALSHLRCWGRSPCPDRSAPGSPAAHRPLPPPPAHPLRHPLHRSPRPSGRRSAGGAGPAATGTGRGRTTSACPCAAGAVGATRSLRRRRSPARPPRCRPAAGPPSGSARRYHAMATSRASRRRKARRRAGRCRRRSQ